MITYSCDICGTDIIDADSWHGEVEESEINRERDITIAYTMNNEAYTEEIKILIDSENSCFCDDCYKAFIMPGIVKELLAKIKEKDEVSQG